MRVVFFGSGDFAVPSLRWLVNSPHEVAAVVTQPDRPAGRGKKLMPTPVADRAQTEGLTAIRCENVNDPAFVERLRGFQADLGIVIDFGQKVLEPARSAFRARCVNLHGSLLPKYRGAAPIAHAILNGEELTGVTVFRLVDRMDAGPILVRRETMIGPDETADDLHARLSRIGCDAIDATLQLLEAEPDTPGEEQDERQATRAPKLAKSDGYLRFDEPASAVVRRCRAMWSWPGARCRYASAGGRIDDVTIERATAVPATVKLPPGTITDVLTVATGAGAIEIHTLKPAGKRLMSWQDFVNGRRVRAGERMEEVKSEE